MTRQCRAIIRFLSSSSIATIFASLIVIGWAAGSTAPDILAQADSQAPTLETTQKWISGFLTEHGCATISTQEGGYLRTCTTTAPSTGCIVVTELAHTRFNSDRSINSLSSGTSHITTNFAEAVLGSARLSDIPIDGSSPSWAGRQVKIENLSGKMIGVFLVDSSENGTRLVRALNVEIQLCGGKPPLF